MTLPTPRSLSLPDPPPDIFVQFVHRVFRLLFLILSLFFFIKFEMYKYDSWLIYTIKLGKNLAHKNENGKKKSSDKFDWELAISTRCRETTCRLSCADLFLCVCQVNPELASCDLNCDLWTALRWTVFAAQPYTLVVFVSPPFFF